jgi:methionine synthase II (cobalamin-independent)
MGMLEGLGGLFESWFQPVKNGILERLRHLAEAVPEDVEMGLHLCYGDFGHAHFVQPADSRRLVELANSATAAISRRLHWVHMPVPVDRFDSGYYEPLGSLQLRDECELYLGLVHQHDGLEGAQRRIAAARQFASGFGIATECGFGRRAHKTVHPLLELHRALSAPVR